MNRFYQSFLFLACLLPSLVSAQVRFDGNLEGSAFGSAELLDSARIVVAPGDTVEHLSFLVNGKCVHHSDKLPEKPVFLTLKPGRNNLIRDLKQPSK